ncbi:GlyGly-CTERM sorting domain-containing protein, partial [Acinetobacter schindleri]|uniref:GlyGly-CTERM sorting domain-containing protein n=2 Tax=Moraxellaceae TaxID=468 RepID=UPI00308FDD17
EVKNNLSQFDYPITYYLYDEEGAKSKPATIYLKNSAKNTNNESSGGGAINIIALFGLLGIAAYRSRRLFKS